MEAGKGKKSPILGAIDVVVNLDLAGEGVIPEVEDGAKVFELLVILIVVRCALVVGVYQLHR